MPHVVERAPTGRAKCRGCGTAIAKGDLRLGEAVPNLYADAEGAESSHWYHLWCAAYRRPEALLQAIETTTEALDERDALVAAAELGVARHRLPRVDQVGRAPSGRATCRECRTPIEKGGWRLSLLFWQDGRFAPAGYIHLGCARAYLGTVAIIDRLRYFTRELEPADASAIAAALEAQPVVTRSAPDDGA